MIEDIQKKTVPISSTPIDEEQTLIKTNKQIISENNKNINILNTISMSELLDNVYTPRTPIIDNFLYTGTYLFVGAPKVGKSFFMALLAHHVSMGTSLWNYNVHKGTVLYLALEDSYGRLQDRFSKMFGTDGNDNLHFSIVSKRIGDGLEEQLKNFINNYKDTRLIIIDTLQKVREISGEKFSYANDYDIVTRLKKFSDDENVCILLVYHTRKQSSEDSFDTISGSNGLLGAADGAFILQKEKRIGNKATIDVVGRDQQDQRFYVEFDRETLLWKLIEAETEVISSTVDPLLQSIANIVNESCPVWEGTATELLNLLEIDNLQPNTLTRKLNVSVERLLNEYGIVYENFRNRNGSNIKLSINFNT